MTGIEEIHQGAVLTLDHSDSQSPHEAAGGEPEIIPHQYNRLNMLAIAVPKASNQFAVLLGSLRMEPLFKLIQDQQHLLLRWQDAAPSQVCERIDQPQSLIKFRTRFSQALEQSGFSLL